MNRCITIVAMALTLVLAQVDASLANHRGGSSHGGGNSGNSGRSNADSRRDNRVYVPTNADGNSKTLTGSRGVDAQNRTVDSSKKKTTKISGAKRLSNHTTRHKTHNVTRHTHARHHFHHRHWVHRPYYVYFACWWPTCCVPIYCPPIGVGIWSADDAELDIPDRTIADGIETVIPGNTEDATETAAEETEVVQRQNGGQLPYRMERRLKVVNTAKEPVEFFLLVHTLEDGEWIWDPAPPGKSNKDVIRFVLEPGEEFVVGEDDDVLTANKIRIWAKSATRSWTQYRDTDLWLIEQDAAGQRRYQAAEIGTFTFRLPD